jgi:hypothetical protein
MIRNHALGPAGSKLPEPYRACCRRPVPSRDGKAPRPLWPLQPPRRWLLGRGPRGRTGIPQVRRGDSTGLDGEGRVSPLVSLLPLLSLLLFLPPARTRDSAVPRRQNQSCRIVGDLSAGDAVTQRNSGTLCLNYFFSRGEASRSSSSSSCRPCGAATGLAWSGDPSTRTCHDLFLLASVTAPTIACTDCSWGLALLAV